MTIYLQSLIDGLLLGGLYATIAVGLSLAFGVMRILNWAHGELLMISMYISFLIVRATNMDPYLTIFITAPIMFGVGFLIQKTLINHLLERDREREPMSVMLLTVGLGMILSNLALLIFGAKPIALTTAYVGKTWIVGDLFISVPRTISFVLAVTFTTLIYFFLQKTETGRALRATSQNREVAELMGMNNKYLYCLAFGISIALVGISSSLLIPLYEVSPSVGNTFSFKCFVIVVLGGQGSIPGALLGGIIIGLVEKFGGVIFSDSVAQLLVFLVFVAILLFKPNGLLSTEK